MQLIAREIELEKMRRFEASRVVETSKKATSETQNATKVKGAAQLPNHLRTLQVKSLKTVKPVSEFFLKSLLILLTSLMRFPKGCFNI